jgi:hypothetical protein
MSDYYVLKWVVSSMLKFVKKFIEKSIKVFWKNINW